jgi:DNA-directed RNA polymerase subunit M/transcription elongation factor TFIIS
MEFCPGCTSVMQQVVVNSMVKYVCVCSYELAATPENLCIYSKNFEEDALSKFKTLLEISPHDPTLCTVEKQCPKCPRKYMGQIRLTENESIFNVCKCGFTAAV